MASHKFKDALEKGKELGKGHEQGKDLAILAYHADTEKGTGEVAEAVYDNSPTSMYGFKGPRASSTRVTHTYSDKLKSLVEMQIQLISIHGHKRNKTYEKNGREIDQKTTIYVSGQNDKLSKEVAVELVTQLGKEYHIETNPDYIPKHLQGTSDNNIVNKSEQGSVQVELPTALRENQEHLKLVSDSLTNVAKDYQKAKEYKGKKAA